jgi:hypothetical protein
MEAIKSSLELVDNGKINELTQTQLKNLKDYLDSTFNIVSEVYAQKHEVKPVDTTKKQSLIDDIESLFTKTDEEIEKLTDEELLQLQSKLSPFHKNMPDEVPFAVCLSTINVREVYARRFNMVAMIAYIFRMIEEHYADNIETDTNSQIIDEINEGKEEKKQLCQLTEEINTRKKHVLQFFNNIFRYNPDLHVRKAIYASKENKSLEEFFAERPNLVIPPADIFNTYQHYCDVNYEELKYITETMFSERETIDNAICVHATFNSIKTDKNGQKRTPIEQCDDYINTHRDKCNASLYNITGGSWTWIASVKGNRDKLSYYNKQTTILQEIINTKTKEEKLGQELMKKRIRKKKLRNIKEQGPDHPGLSNYAASIGRDLTDMGAEPGLTDEEKKEIAKKMGKEEELKKMEDDMKKVEEEEDVEGAVKIEVFKTDGNTMEKTSFWTEAENADETAKKTEFTQV